MRLQLQLTPNTQLVPFNHIHFLTGAIHKWLGPENDIHDGLSLYSFGWLRGGQGRKEGLTFPKGATWNISFFDDTVTRQLIKGLLKQPDVMYGMRVIATSDIPTPNFGESYLFKTDGSSVVARSKRADGSRAYLLWDDPAADEAITGLLKQKLIKAGYAGDDLSVRVSFDRSYSEARTKKIKVKTTEHKGSECPVLVEGTPEAVRFAWLVGIGDLTGSGFGGLR
ncbi:CRISPR-associated endoribonuclease Cas6 [Fibrella aquatilis]|uniref:CRISPR-associated endoribonuclease Cas6 n=1 Tax=Fibrella aquatilis TaxID=2817059 RepID=A0A939JXJ0_9BACT|nr:CRISPR-associated endoribonuclease Cas6 [Fibrella aquatilis]MBO0933007.1 CRISPR-associated endoribonuclease Cas6 [Fibrella aquatilis]